MARTSIKHVTIRVEGIVQGVGFRWSVRSVAASLGIAGSVRNEDDGSVLIEAEAEAPVVDAFIEWCHKGSAASRVDRVVVEPGPVKGLSGFMIRF